MPIYFVDVYSNQTFHLNFLAGHLTDSDLFGNVFSRKTLEILCIEYMLIPSIKNCFSDTSLNCKPTYLSRTDIIS